MSTTKLFISHARDDEPLVKAFVGLLESGIGVPPRDIFCSSLKGQGIKPGAEFKDSIREHLDDATCVIALITPNFYNSAFCMCELGGVWLHAKSFIPMIVPPLAFSDLKAVLIGLQALKIADAADLDELRDESAERLSMKPLPTPRWNEHRDSFLKELPGILRDLPANTPIPRSAHERTVKELDDYKAEYAKAEQEIERLQKLNADLTKLKDSAKVAAAIRKHSTTVEAFESLVRAAKRSLAPLSFTVREALYYGVTGNDYYPEQWDDVHPAIEEGQVAFNADENGVHPRKSDPQVGKAIEALKELESWLDAPPEDFSDWYKTSFKDPRPDMTLRPFWRQHLT
jgi:hypothetical protein